MHVKAKQSATGLIRMARGSVSRYLRFAKKHAIANYGYLRLQKPVSALAGPMYVRSRELIEIDVTYACNLKCFNCNRSVRQAPSRESMSVEQIQRFVDESLSAQIQWKRIRLLGGEPTVHPDFSSIIEVLKTYKEQHSPGTVIAVHTNGFGNRVNRVLRSLPEGIKVVSSEKTSNENDFYPFNLAPRDSLFYRFADYSVGCRVPAVCGVGLTPYGYYACAVAGGIDRILGLDIGRKSLPAAYDDMRDQLRQLCGYCGSFKLGGFSKGIRGADHEVESVSWRQAYARYRKEKPILSRY